MLDANKYIDRLRIIVKSVEEMGNKKSYNLPQHRLDFITNRIKDLVRDYDMDFSKAMEEMEDEGTRRGRETAEYLKQLKSV